MFLEWKEVGFKMKKRMIFMKISRDRMKGFSLIEVLVAMFVFGYGIMAVLAFLSRSFLYAGKLDSQVVAYSLLKSVEFYFMDVDKNTLTGTDKEFDDWSIFSNDEIQLFNKKLGTDFKVKYDVYDYQVGGRDIKYIALRVLWKGRKYELSFIRE